MRILGLGYAPLDHSFLRADEGRNFADPAAWEGADHTGGGGSTANTLCTLAALGHECHFLASVGDDDRAARVEADLRRRRVIPHLSRRPGTRTPRIACLVGSDGERRFVFDFAGAPPDYDADDFRGAGVDPSAYDMLVTEMFGGAADDIAAESRRVVFAAQPPHTPDPLEKFRIMWKVHRSLMSLLSAELLAALEAEPSTRPVREKVFSSEASARLVFVSDGPRGLHVHHKGRSLRIPAPPVVRVVDTTGAGDALLAGLLHRLGPALLGTAGRLDDESLRSAGMAAQAVAALCCGTVGARGHLDDVPSVRAALAGR